jgi:hypothetical protein
MYIPKNKISTNLYSQNDDLVYKSNQKKYTGYYYKTYDGRYFTGKNPDDGVNDELVKVEPTETGYNPTTLQSKIAFTDAPTIFDSIDAPGYSEEMIVNYTSLKNIDLNKSTYKHLPTSYYPKPTQEDYNLGVFTRYFCVKINEDIYLEIDKKTYDALTNQKGDWLWQLYTPFQLLWTISGEEKEIEKTNYNITLLQEKRLKRRGLQEFLRNNYLKFYPSPYSVSDVTSSITPTITPVKENKPSIKDLFKITNPRPNLIISPEEIANAQTATPLVTSSVGNPLTGIRVDTSFEDPKSDQRRT